MNYLNARELSELPDNETYAECKEVAWQMFCKAHPIEAYAHDPQAFWRFFQTVAPGVTHKRMIELLKECEE